VVPPKPIAPDSKPLITENNINFSKDFPRNLISVSDVPELYLT
jgi:PhoPQ-activated pathogenicity-related protein